MKSLKNRSTRIEKAGPEDLSTAGHQLSILLVNYAIGLLCHLSAEKESFLPVCDLCAVEVVQADLLVLSRVWRRGHFPVSWPFTFWRSDIVKCLEEETIILEKTGIKK